MWRRSSGTTYMYSKLHVGDSLYYESTMIVDSELGTRSPTALGLNRTQRHLHVPGTRTDSEEGYTLQYSTLQAFCFFYTLRRIVPATYSSTHRRFRLASAPQS